MPGTLIIKAPAAAKIAIAKITKVSNTNLGFIKAWLKSLRIPIFTALLDLVTPTLAHL